MSYDPFDPSPRRHSRGFEQGGFSDILKENRQLIEELRDLGAGTTIELAIKLAHSPALVQHHLQKLVDEGLVTPHREGEDVFYTLSGPARRALSR